ncbi:acyl-CoA carboxylase subunit epsilon [Streptomyces piniterrae]|uniref:Acyl-CoA carboxylase subunit epsilon n=1 Tax=Streptomyces piniterrae TaxID=2571125 RepID=A0A4U0MU54_9ACTN|nr:acyl-CoA carboxylase subunit epsilon [Streptomyces piniterrae]TJZ44453.1 acyl-CoA carboxylase subunit epsilon [Streptomyces piniterrae]
MSTSASPDPPGVPLRIDRGSAEPEELAALTVILCAAHLFRASAATDHRRKHRAVHDMRGHPVRTACWSGCWSCA